MFVKWDRIQHSHSFIHSHAVNGCWAPTGSGTLSSTGDKRVSKIDKIPALIGHSGLLGEGLKDLNPGYLTPKTMPFQQWHVVSHSLIIRPQAILHWSSNISTWKILFSTECSISSLAYPLKSPKYLSYYTKIACMIHFQALFTLVLFAWNALCYIPSYRTTPYFSRPNSFMSPVKMLPISYWELPPSLATHVECLWSA